MVENSSFLQPKNTSDSFRVLIKNHSCATRWPQEVTAGLNWSHLTLTFTHNRWKIKWIQIQSEAPSAKCFWLLFRILIRKCEYFLKTFLRTCIKKQNKTKNKTCLFPDAKRERNQKNKTFERFKHQFLGAVFYIYWHLSIKTQLL